MSGYAKMMNKEIKKSPEPKELNFSSPWKVAGGKKISGKLKEIEKSKDGHGDKEARAE